MSYHGFTENVTSDRKLVVDLATRATHPELWCPHCANNCVVVLDGVDAAAPCPMCAGGAARNQKWTSAGTFWATPRSAAGYSWSGGLTVDHTRMCSSRDCFRLVPRGDSSCADCLGEPTPTVSHGARLQVVGLVDAANTDSSSRESVVV